MKSFFLLILLMFKLVLSGYSQKPRARDLGIPFNGETGIYNAITDVSGVEVGHCTIIEGVGESKIGEGPVRTGVTAIFPRGKESKFSPVYSNWYSLNGNGEMTGTTWITESGFLETPIMITNTNSVGIVRDAVLKWFTEVDWYKNAPYWYTYPVVAETLDLFLNDVYGFHVKEEHVYEAIDNASSGKVIEGNVGGGTGMGTLGFKGGIGTSSRIVNIGDSTYTLGVLVQSNFGAKKNLTIAGVPVGMELIGMKSFELKQLPESHIKQGDGSIIVIVATDAPLLPHQLKRIAQRVPIGIGLTGGRGGNGSGDIFLAFSTANINAFNRDKTIEVSAISNDQINPLFEATVEAVEESIINAMIAAETMEGVNGNKMIALPHDKLVEILKKYNRHIDPKLLSNITVDLEKFCGTYELPDVRLITISQHNNKLYYTSSTNSVKQFLKPIDLNNFRAPFGGKLTFIEDRKGQIIELNVLFNGENNYKKVIK